MVKKVGNNSNQNTGSYDNFSNQDAFEELKELHTCLETKLGKVTFWGKKKDREIEIGKIYAKVDKGRIVFKKKGFFSWLFNTPTMDKDAANALAKLFEKTSKLNLNTEYQSTLDEISQLALKINKIAEKTLIPTQEGSSERNRQKMLHQGTNNQDHNSAIIKLKTALTESSSKTIGAQLCSACRAADLDKISELLDMVKTNQQLKENVLKYQDAEGNTPLHLVCPQILLNDQNAINNRVQILRNLISEGADPNIKNNSGFTALSFANKNENYKAAYVLLNCPNLKIDKSDTKSVDAIKKLFQMACSEHNLENINRIIALVENDNELKTAMLNHKDEQGNTPLHLVCQQGENFPNKQIILKLLIDQGLDINLKNNEGFTPFCSAINNKDITTAEVILMCPNFNIDKSASSISAIQLLLMAVIKKSEQNDERTKVNDQKIVKKIVELLKNDQELKNSILNSKYIYGVTPLRYAIEISCSLAIIQLLMSESNIDDHNLDRMITELKTVCNKQGIKHIDPKKSDVNDSYEVKILKMLLNYQSTKIKEAPSRPVEKPPETEEDRIKRKDNVEKFVEALRKEYVGNNKNLPSSNKKRSMEINIKKAMGFNGTDDDFRKIVRKAALLLHPDKIKEKHLVEQYAPTKNVKRAEDELTKAKKTGDKQEIEKATKVLENAKLALHAQGILDQKVQLALKAQEDLVQNIKESPEKNILVAKKALQKAIDNNEPDEVREALNKNLKRAEEVNDIDEFCKFFNAFSEHIQSKVAPREAQIEKTDVEINKEKADKIVEEKVNNLFRVATGPLYDEVLEKLKDPLQMLIRCFVQNGEKSTINQNKVADIKSAILGNSNNPAVLKEIYDILDPVGLGFNENDTNYNVFENMRMFLNHVME